MRWTVLGSGGCTVIPKPLCQCRVCREARRKGPPYSRSGPSVFLHDIHLLVDTPAEISELLNRSSIRRIDYLILTHLDPDHVEGLRVVEQIALDFRTWRGYPAKRVRLLLPQELDMPLRELRCQYGPLLDFYCKSGFVSVEQFQGSIKVQDVQITAISLDQGTQTSFVYVFERMGHKVVYAPCDIKPFPEHRREVQKPDLLMVQPGIFENGLKHGFKYPASHCSRKTLYTFEETLELARRLQAKKVLFTHLEEYWNRSYDDYLALQRTDPTIRFAYDGIRVTV
jgi:phosphoribosyl 1,2-cyclic phosphate phosphodiesterase